MTVTAPLFKIEWTDRADPLEPVAAIAFGAAALRLRDRLLARSDEELAALLGVAGAELLLVAGPAVALPWADGVVYLGRDRRAPAILLPTNRTPNAPVDLLERALLGRFADRRPFAVVERRIVPVGALRPIARAFLEDFGRAGAGRPADF